MDRSGWRGRLTADCSSGGGCACRRPLNRMDGHRASPNRVRWGVYLYVAMADPDGHLTQRRTRSRPSSGSTRRRLRSVIIDIVSPAEYSDMHLGFNAPPRPACSQTSHGTLLRRLAMFTPRRRACRFYHPLSHSRPLFGICTNSLSGKISAEELFLRSIVELE